MQPKLALITLEVMNIEVINIINILVNSQHSHILTWLCVVVREADGGLSVFSRPPLLALGTGERVDHSAHLSLSLAASSQPPKVLSACRTWGYTASSAPAFTCKTLRGSD